MLAHGAVLHKNGFSAQQVIAILEDYHQAGLTPLEVDMMDYATKMTSNPPAVVREDVERLREDGLNDQQITEVALVAAARNFISRFFEAMGASPDLELQQQEPELWGYLKEWKQKV